MAWNTNLRRRLPLFCLLFEVAMVVLFALYVRFNPDSDPDWKYEKRKANITSDIENEFYYSYPSKCLPSKPACGWALTVAPGCTTAPTRSPLHRKQLMYNPL